MRQSPSPQSSLTSPDLLIPQPSPNQVAGPRIHRPMHSEGKKAPPICDGIRSNCDAKRAMRP